MVDSNWLWIVGALSAVAGFCCGVVYSIMDFIAKGAAAAAAHKPEENKPPIPDGTWHFGRIKKFERSEDRTHIVFEDGQEINCSFKLPYSFEKGHFVRFYFGCKNHNDSQTALIDFVEN